MLYPTKDLQREKQNKDIFRQTKTEFVSDGPALKGSSEGSCSGEGGQSYVRVTPMAGGTKAARGGVQESVCLLG